MPKQNNYQRKIKSPIFLLRLHYLFPSHLLKFFGEFSDLSKFVHQHKNIEFCDFYSSKFDYKKREKLFDYVIEKENLNSGIDYLEFGVSKGGSFRWWADQINHPDAKFYGFDTFTGLPEDWGPFKAGDMSNGNEPPKMDDERVSFYQGVFQQTLVPFLANYKADRNKPTAIEVNNKKMCKKLLILYHK